MQTTSHIRLGHDLCVQKWFKPPKLLLKMKHLQHE